MMPISICCFFFSSRRRHTRCLSDWSSDVCSSDLNRRRLGSCNVRRQNHNQSVKLADEMSVEVHLETLSLRAPWIRLVAAAVLLAAPGMALDPRKAITQYLQSVWATDAGLPQTSVFSIAQTTDGYLWVGTEQGLARLDGVRFTVSTGATTRDSRRTIFKGCWRAGMGAFGSVRATASRTF